MPPHVPRKFDQPTANPGSARTTALPAANTLMRRGKAALFDAADAASPNEKSAEETRSLLDSLSHHGVDSPLDDIESDDFEDVPPAKKRRMEPVAAAQSEDSDGMDWEDALRDDNVTASATANHDDLEINDISVTMNDDGSYIERDVQERMSSATKGPTKRERLTRNLTHCLHVQSLLWHNTVRNSWLNDKIVQKTLVDALPVGVVGEISHWKGAMGYLSTEELQAQRKKHTSKPSNRKGGRGTEKGRDWSYNAQHSEQSHSNLSSGDPLLRLLRVLTAYWRKRFLITAPAFRKRGYMSLRRLRQEIKDWEKNRDDASEHGERIENVQVFRDLAHRCEGSRDVGNQLFVALLRGIGVDTRMVANLQPAGIGWSKAEEADEKKTKKKAALTEKPDKKPRTEAIQKNAIRATAKGAQTCERINKRKRKSNRGKQAGPIHLDDSDSPLSELPSDAEPKATFKHDIDNDDDDDDSLINMTPDLPNVKSRKVFDRDLAFPTYWAEVCSPVSNKFIPIDPIVLSTIASTDDLLQTFEPRGKKADMAKQVICYVTAFSADGTAKDVTVRYIKKHQLPSKTKGMRMPTEKIPIYDKRGKIKKYESYDWFKTVMTMYNRPEIKRTPADDLEERTDLKPFKPKGDENLAEKESLQWYKQSAEYVLEQHLRREEAILPKSEPIKTFKAGKGDKAKDYDVYRREDVVICKTVESWHKEGREIKTGEQPVKHVPVRAVTLIKKREIEEAERETGEKMKQGLYSRDQTDWIIPPPIQDGIIPKNAYGNMDVYVETMVPKGAVHLKLKGSAKICRKLEIDYAEACTGFEFGKQRAVPVLTGVVVAEENAQMVKDAWRSTQEEIQRKEDAKRTATSLRWWRKMLMGMRIVERMRAEYDQSDKMEEEVNLFVGRASRTGRANPHLNAAGEGGFLRSEEVADSYSSVTDPCGNGAGELGVGDLLQSDNEDGKTPSHDGLLIEEQTDPATPIMHIFVEPLSLQSACKSSDDAGEEIMDDPRTSLNIRQAMPGQPTFGTNPCQNDTSHEGVAKSPEKAKRRPRTRLDVKTSRLKRSNNLFSEPGDSKLPMAHRRLRRSAEKVTPSTSKYFIAQDTNDVEDTGALSSADEVVLPRRTTARTRKG